VRTFVPVLDEGAHKHAFINPQSGSVHGSSNISINVTKIREK